MDPVLLWPPYPGGEVRASAGRRLPDNNFQWSRANLDLQSLPLLEPNIPPHSLFLLTWLNQQIQPKNSRAISRAPIRIVLPRMWHLTMLCSNNWWAKFYFSLKWIKTPSLCQKETCLPLPRSMFMHAYVRCLPVCLGLGHALFISNKESGTPGLSCKLHLNYWHFHLFRELSSLMCTELSCS